MKRVKLFRGLILALAFLLGVGSITTAFNMNRDNSAAKVEAAGYPDVRMESAYFDNYGFQRRFNNGSFSVSNWSPSEGTNPKAFDVDEGTTCTITYTPPAGIKIAQISVYFYSVNLGLRVRDNRDQTSWKTLSVEACNLGWKAYAKNQLWSGPYVIEIQNYNGGSLNHVTNFEMNIYYPWFNVYKDFNGRPGFDSYEIEPFAPSPSVQVFPTPAAAAGTNTHTFKYWALDREGTQRLNVGNNIIYGEMMWEYGYIGVGGAVTIYAIWDIDYPVIFNKMGGTGGVDGIIVEDYSHFPDTIPNGAPTRDDADFAHYWLLPGGQDTAGNTRMYISYDGGPDLEITQEGSYRTKPEGKFTFYAWWFYWCDVYFDNNGGPTPPITTTSKIRYLKPLPDISGETVPTRPGYEFLGYYDAKTGGKQYYDKDLKRTDSDYWLKNEEKPVCFYAQWKVTYFTLNYKDEGGASFSGVHEDGYPTKHTPGTDTQLKSASKTGYTFGGWHLKSDCSDAAITVLGANDFTDDITLYAKWTANTYKVRFDFQEGTSEVSYVDATFGSDMPAATMPTYENHTFAGYYDAANGGTKYYNSDGSSAKAWDKAIDDTILYAHWTINIDLNISMSPGFTGTWDGNKHWAVVTAFDAVSEEEITDATIYYGTSEESCNDPDLNNFKYDAVGTYIVYFKVVKDGYTVTPGSKTFTIGKAESIVDPTPKAITGLEYTALDQQLIVAGEVDYGEMLYAVSLENSQIPADDEFHADIPIGKNVGTYYVFYKSSGDSNHNPYVASLSNVVTVNIARVDRTAATNLNNNVKDYLETLDDRFTTIHDDLEVKRAAFEQDAIVEDNITAAAVEQKVNDLKAELSEAKVDVTEVLINAIGTVVYPDSNDAILEALNYYNDVLDADEKAAVNADLVTTMNNADELYKAVDEMAKIIESISSPEDSQKYYDAVDAAEEAYNNLTPEQLLTLQNATDFDYEKKLLDNIAAREVIELIEKIGDVKYNGGTNDSLQAIKDAEEAYELLTIDQKALVDSVNHQDLVNDRKVYDSVDHTVELINEIGKVENSKETKDRIEAAREAYDALSGAEKALVKGYQDSYKTLDDAEQVYKTLVLIDNIGNVDYDTDPEGRIAQAREAYDSLTEEQKAQVGDLYLKILVKAEADSARITKTNTIWLIIGLVLSFLVLVGAFFFIFFLLFKRRKDDDDDDDENKNEKSSSKKEPVKVMSVGGGGLTLVTLVSHYSDAPWIVLYIFAPLAFLALVAAIVLYILKRKGKGPFDKDRLAKKAAAKAANKPVLASQKEDEEEVETVTDERGNVFQIRFIKSFTAKLIQSPEETKKYYEELKNEVLSYKKTNSRISWHYDAVNSGRAFVLKFAIRGKTLCVYLPLDAEKQEEKFKVEKVESKKFEEVPCLYRIKDDRRCDYAKELIAKVCESMGLEKGKEQHEVYSNLPYEPNKPLIARGLIKEQKIAVNKPAESVVLESKVNADGDEILLTKDAIGNIFEIRYIKSFTAKLSQSEDVVKDYYTELKNHVLSYKDTHSRVSWHYDAINVGRDYVLKFSIRGKTLCVYLALVPSKLDEKYKAEEAKGKKYEDVPCLYRIKNDRRLGYAKELIDMLMRKLKVEQGEIPSEDYHIKKESTKALLAKGLIKERKTKVVDKKVEEHYASISVTQADEVMSDEKAEAAIEEDVVSKKREGKKEVVNIDTLSQHYKDGDVVTLDSLIEKKLVSPKAGYVKVLARGVLDKKLTVDLHDYSLQAVKMIVLMGGYAKKIK